MILAGASGGLIPVGAVLMSEAVGDLFSSLKRAIVHASTRENGLAMRAGRRR